MINKSRKQIVCLAAAFALGLTTLPCSSLQRTPGKSGFSYGLTNIYASTTEGGESLDSVDGQVDELEEASSNVSGEISSTKTAINEKLTALETIESEITAKQAEIDQCTLDLSSAETLADGEYEAMKLRIRYMYENSTINNLWTAIAESHGIADMLNRMEYVTTMYKKDRELLTAYQNAVNEIKSAQTTLCTEMETLLTLRDNCINQKTALEENIYNLADQQEEYAEQIIRYYELEAQYGTIMDGMGSYVEKAEAAAAATFESEEARQGEDESAIAGTENPAAETKVSGDEIIAYALEFVGKPYKLGGNSLTEGCGPAEFVHLVYDHFGINTPRYSLGLLNAGQKVSYDCLQAGDIVIYPGHVGIYMSDGCIIEAQCEAAGITQYRSVDWAKIVGIRRYI